MTLIIDVCQAYDIIVVSSLTYLLVPCRESICGNDKEMVVSGLPRLLINGKGA